MSPYPYTDWRKSAVCADLIRICQGMTASLKADLAQAPIGSAEGHALAEAINRLGNGYAKGVTDEWVDACKDFKPGDDFHPVESRFKARYLDFVRRNAAESARRVEGFPEGPEGEDREIMLAMVKQVAVTAKDYLARIEALLAAPVPSDKAPGVQQIQLSGLVTPKGECLTIGAETGKAPADGVGCFFQSIKLSIRSATNAKGGSYRFVRVVGGEIVAGLQVMSLTGRGGEVANVFCREGDRRRGYATELLAAAERKLGPLEISSDLSSDGRAWVASVAAKDPPTDDEQVSHHP